MYQDAIKNPNLKPHVEETPDPENDCFLCWQFNTKLPYDKMKLNNPKYCRLYPKNVNQEIKSIIPKFDHCKTLYTKCDYDLEQGAHKITLKLEDLFKRHNELVEAEIEVQKKLVDDMWNNSQRYLILSRGGVCIKLYPEIISESTERRALCNFHRNLRKVHASNNCLSLSLSDIRATMSELQCQCAKLDRTIESPFQVGVYYLKSLRYIRSIIADVFQYFNQQLCKLKIWAQLLDPGDAVAIEDYIELLNQINNDENNLRLRTQNCHCMRSKRTECMDRIKTC